MRCGTPDDFIERAAATLQSDCLEWTMQALCTASQGCFLFMSLFFNALSLSLFLFPLSSLALKICLSASEMHCS